MKRRRPRSIVASETAHLRGLNLERILTFAIAHEAEFTRRDIVAATKLSTPTVGSLSEELVRLGLFLDRGVGPSRGGRRPAFMEFNARHGFVVGIDISPTWTHLAVADLRGRPVTRGAMRTSPRRGPGPVLASVVARVKELLSEAQIPMKQLLSVAAGVPGVVDRERGEVVALAPNLTGWSAVSVGRVLGRGLRAPVVMENDVNLAVLGERWRGAAHGHDTCAYIAVGAGVGAGIVVDGHLHHGHRFLAGEIALMCMGPQFVGQEFGARGCLETLVGLGALARRWRGDGQRLREGWVTDLFDAARRRDARAVAIVDEAATLVAIATANISVVLDPSLIVLGGALIAPDPLLLERVRTLVARIVRSVEIVPSALGEEAPLYGSLMVATNTAQETLRRRLRHMAR